ncbi:enoyl-CoA hydratase/isomerase family protein [Nioella sp.]|uniref:enoyl-CoA hydratase/isomerase family protein n=1 Tax=Nioella sp. TaxID=1912091 RepID=UPI003A883448
MSCDIVQIHREGNVARMVMNRPAARISLSLAMLDAMFDAIKSLGQAPDVHVIILAANGPGFCAGHDLKEITTARTAADQGRAFFEDTMARCARLMQAIGSVRITCLEPAAAGR